MFRRMNFWRSLEIYSDHQTRRYEEAGVPLERIDTTSFMPGVTGTIYRRGFQEWKGSLLATLARGGWIDTSYGNLELLKRRRCPLVGPRSILVPAPAVHGTYPYLRRYSRRGPTLWIRLARWGWQRLCRRQPSAGDRFDPSAAACCGVRKPLAGGRLQFRDAGFVPQLNGDTSS